MQKTHHILLIFLCVLASCSPRTIHDAQTVVAQADSLWHEGKMYGVDEGDSASLAHAYETLKAIPLPFSLSQGEGRGEVFPHACYHYGRLLRAKDDPVSAMQVFIDATHSHSRDYHILGRIYSNMGSICHLAGEFLLSYDMYKRSADMFLKNGDSLSYYYGLNDMAFELAEQGEKEKTYLLINSIRKQSEEQELLLSTIGTKAECCLKCKQYDSVLYYTQLLDTLGYIHTTFLYTLKAKAYSFLGQKDSAVYYADLVLSLSDDLYDKNSVLYILTHDDKSKNISEVREISADRSDVQKRIEIKQGKLSQAVQLLDQDMNLKKDYNWLIAIAGTIIIMGFLIGIYVIRRRKRKVLLSQQIEQLEMEFNDKQTEKRNQINQTCSSLLISDHLLEELHWKEYDKMCLFVNENFFFLVNKLKQKKVLNETEIRLCVLVLIGLNRAEISRTLPYASNSVGKLKDHTAKLLGTSGKNLHDFLLKMAIEE